MKYTLTLTKEQLQAVQRALNCTFRFKMGQFGDMLEETPTKEGGRLYGWDIQEEVSKLLKPKMGLESNASFGVNNFDDIDEMITIHDGIRHFLLMEDVRENGTKPFGVGYNKPTNYFGGLVEVSKV